MESQHVAELAQAQHEARTELAGFLSEMQGPNTPVELVIAYRCPDGQVGYWKTKGNITPLVGLLEITKHALIQGGMNAGPAEATH